MKAFWNLPFVEIGLGFFAGMLWAYYTAFGIDGAFNVFQQWQELIAGLVAIIAALVGAKAIKNQTKQQLEYQEQVRQAAVRAKVIGDIMDIHEYLENAHSYLECIRDGKEAFAPEKMLKACLNNIEKNVGQGICRSIIKLECFIEAIERRREQGYDDIADAALYPLVICALIKRYCEFFIEGQEIKDIGINL